MFFTKEKGFYHNLIRMALPIAAQNLLTFSISMADSVMVGGLGEVALSATSLANRFFFILMILIYGIVGGSNVLIAQYWGKKDVVSIHKVMAIMYRVVFGATVLFVAIAQIWPEAAIRLYAGDNLEVVKSGAQYLRTVSWGFLLYSITNATVIVMRSVQTVKIANLIYGVSLGVNVFFNWALIYGNLGFPAMGITGAAIATVMSRVAEFIVLIVFLWRYETKLRLSLSKLAKIERSMLKSFVQNCTPVIANEGLWVAGSTLTGMISGRLGTNVIAASGIEGVLWQLVTVFLFGLQNATAVIVGNSIGAGEMSQLKERSQTLMSIGYFVGPIAGGLMLLLKPVALSFYQSFDLATLELASELMNISAILLIFQSLNFIGMMGILRGGGDLKFVLIFDVIFLWVIALPVGYLTGLVWGWPAPLVFLCLRLDEVVKSLFCLWRVNSHKWAKNLTLDT